MPRPRIVGDLDAYQREVESVWGLVDVADTAPALGEMRPGEFVVVEGSTPATTEIYIKLSSGRIAVFNASSLVEENGENVLANVDQLHVGTEADPDLAQSAALWVSGEMIVQKIGTPPTGHPGTPFGSRRIGMPDNGTLATTIGTAVVTDTGYSTNGFGNVISMQGSSTSGAEKTMGHFGFRQIGPDNWEFVVIARTSAGFVELFKANENGMTVLP